ncbi:MAG: hypothetical protein WA269_11715 [Candidatus Udaeobacter sp.]
MKQAVVLIHGIGEQKPMDTLRSFVSAVLEPAPDGKDNYWNKPDPMSELFELRRLQAIGRTKIHFYEYYWAYNVEGTTIWHVFGWLGGLLRRPGKDVPDSAKTLWWILRILTSAVVLLTVAGTLAQLRSWFDAFKVLSVPWLLVMGCGSVIYFLLVRYLGDAARYCSAAPQNIKLRQTIRAEGLKLLRTLHERGEYDRIVVVGHSLGSVIGYDLLKRLWQDYHEQYPGLETPATRAMVRAAMAAKEGGPQPTLRNVISVVGEALQADSSDARLKEFQDRQKDVLAELQRFGNPWRITDFITLGSPLVHAMLLLADSKEDFDRRKHQREFPTCPPQRDEKGYTFGGKTPVDVGEGKKFTPLFLHHAAPFAVTQWTNLYFPALGGIFGDIVGGRLRPEFGPGIRDVEVRTQALGPFANHTVLAHTKYWDQTGFRPVAGAETNRKLSLAVLRETLAFSRGRTIRGHSSILDTGQSPANPV